MKVELTKKEFNDILGNYDVGKYSRSKYFLTGDNTVYKVVTSKGEFILKIYQKAGEKFVNYQIKLMEFLSRSRVSTPKIIDTKKGEGLLMWKGQRIALQEFARGKERELVNERLAKDMGKKLGVLAKTLEGFRDRVDGGYPKEHEFKLVKWKKSRLFGYDLGAESSRLLKDIGKLDKSKLKKSLIHGDICEGNFLVEKDKVSAIIDWDDAHEDFRVYEVAVTIANNFTMQRGVKRKCIRIFFKEYLKYVRLNNEEKKALYYFVKRSSLAGATWCYDWYLRHPKNKKKERKQTLKWTKVCLNKYFSFDKVSLDEWMGFFG
jgi:homoserine kinase type II